MRVEGTPPLCDEQFLARGRDGVGEGDAVKLAVAFNIKTMCDLGTNKYFRLAAALADLDK